MSSAKVESLIAAGLKSEIYVSGSLIFIHDYDKSQETIARLIEAYGHPTNIPGGGRLPTDIKEKVLLTMDRNDNPDRSQYSEFLRPCRDKVVS